MGFDLSGNVVYTSGSFMDNYAARVGHYPDERSENKGNEPENVAFGKYYSGNKKATDYLFVNSERSSIIFVYDVTDDIANPIFKQVLPAGLGPEGGLSLPDRNLFA